MYMRDTKDFTAAKAHTSVAVIAANSKDEKTRRELVPNQNLFWEGEEAKCVYEVVTGVVRIAKFLENGRRQVIAFAYPGDIVGFPQDGMHNAECDAISSAEVIAHDIVDLEDSAHDPKLHLLLVQAAIKEVGAMQKHFTMLGRMTASEKIANFLSVLLERLGRPLGQYTQFELPMNRTDMADFLGLTIETVSRTMSKFRKMNLIELDGSKSVIVLNEDALFDMMEEA